MNGTAEYTVLGDGYQIVQMGGVVNRTTVNNGVLQVYGAMNNPTIKGGRSDAAFTLGSAGSAVDISTYECILPDNGNYSWSLAENRVQMSPSAADALNMATAQPLMPDVGLGTVRGCLGNVKGVNYDTTMWSSATNSRNNMSTDARASFERISTGLVLGTDSRFSHKEGSTT